MGNRPIAPVPGRPAQASPAPDRGKPLACGICHAGVLELALAPRNREALTSNGIHDTILAVGIAAIPLLIFCLIVNRLRHPNRSFLAALAVSVLGFFLVPSVATGTAILWVYTGGAGGQAIGVGVVLWLLGFWLFRQWLRSAPRSARRAQAVAPSRARELTTEVQDEKARLHAAEMNREAEWDTHP